ncbi:MAG: phosphoribosylformylglycinamidine synthase subunit PurQ [Alphaproteobacteria bacterium]|nr:phosphoribosylformylglycinamidine synthase subunit PurQ [Alphaproteobacteria bacterium]
MTAKALVVAGYGLNCEEETAQAFSYAGLGVVIRHVNDLADNPKELESVQILAIPGGFSYGDDTGSGNAFAQKMRLTLMDHLKKFVERDTLTLGICNGCQIAINLGLAPAFDKKYGERVVAVSHNLTARYQCRWVDVSVQSSTSPWLSGITRLHVPVAHGEGRFMMDDGVLATLRHQKQIALRYVKPDGSAANGEFPFSPNGSTDDIAGITDETGRVLALMPHPERGMFTSQRDDYATLKDAARRAGKSLPDTADGMDIFKNAAHYFETAKSRKSA